MVVICCLKVEIYLSVALTGAQVSDQQLLATKDIHWQKAVTSVVAVREKQPSSGNLREDHTRVSTSSSSLIRAGINLYV